MRIAEIIIHPEMCWLKIASFTLIYVERRITIIQGDPGEGKTTLALHLAAACSSGDPLPEMELLEPMQGYLNESVDMNRVNEIRSVLKQLSFIAERNGCVVILVGHLNKSNGTGSQYRGLGSIYFRAAARSVLPVGRLKNKPNVRERDVEQNLYVTKNPETNLACHSIFSVFKKRVHLLSEREKSLNKFERWLTDEQFTSQPHRNRR